LQCAAPDLVTLERLEERLEIALAKAVVALALDEFEEDGAQQRAGKDLSNKRFLPPCVVPSIRMPRACSSGTGWPMARQSLFKHLVSRRRWERS
jgi:hypothetical protein